MEAWTAGSQASAMPCWTHSLCLSTIIIDCRWIENKLSWHLPAPVQWRSGVCQVWCPLPLRAGANSPSHVCWRALSAWRDPGFQAELSHAIVPQNSSALRIFSKALMGQYVWFSTVSTLAQVPLLGSLPAFLLVSGQWWQGRGTQGGGALEMVALAARAALHTWSCTKLIFWERERRRKGFL